MRVSRTSWLEEVVVVGMIRRWSLKVVVAGESGDYDCVSVEAIEKGMKSQYTSILVFTGVLLDVHPDSRSSQRGVRKTPIHSLLLILAEAVN